MRHPPMLRTKVGRNRSHAGIFFGLVAHGGQRACGPSPPHSPPPRKTSNVCTGGPSAAFGSNESVSYGVPCTYLHFMVPTLGAHFVNETTGAPLRSSPSCSARSVYFLRSVIWRWFSGKISYSSLASFGS